MNDEKIAYVGMGVTELLYSDRHAYEVVEVISDKELVIRRCKATRIDHNGMSESQEYEYELEPYEVHATLGWDGMEFIPPEFGDNNVRIKKYKSGWKRKGEPKDSTRFVLGVKREYYDYSF